jgi:hypothetical protein
VGGQNFIAQRSYRKSKAFIAGRTAAAVVLTPLLRLPRSTHSLCSCWSSIFRIAPLAISLQNKRSSIFDSFTLNIPLKWSCVCRFLLDLRIMHFGCLIGNQRGGCWLVTVTRHTFCHIHPPCHTTTHHSHKGVSRYHRSSSGTTTS